MVHNYYYVGSRLEYETIGDSEALWYFYDADGNPSGIRYKDNSGTVNDYYFVCNWRGDVIQIYNASGTLVGSYSYDAWGKPIFEQASSGSEALIMAMIIAATNVAYRSYFYDFDTELYYLRSRYYDPEIGRFINADDTAYLGADKSPLSFNLFAYCFNNPIFISDHYVCWSKIITITVNFYRLNTLHEHCDISYNGETVSYGTTYGDGTASWKDKIKGTQGYFVHKDTWRSFDCDKFTTIKVKAYENLYYDFWLDQSSNSEYWFSKKNNKTGVWMSVLIPKKIMFTTHINYQIFEAIDIRGRSNE